MRIRAPLLLLLLPTLAVSLATDATDDIDTLAPVRPDKGTKDAPVDGLDGKPHAGPFVYGTKERVKLESKVEDLSSSRFSDEVDKARAKGQDIPDKVDSVMTDREGQRKGKGSIDGTEGGISQKERNRAKSGSDGGEKRPEGPNEVLEGHEHAKEKIVNAGGGKDSASYKSLNKDENRKEKGIGGLEVRCCSIPDSWQTMY
jgi:hypothetical protein